MARSNSARGTSVRTHAVHFRPSAFFVPGLFRTPIAVSELADERVRERDRDTGAFDVHMSDFRRRISVSCFSGDEVDLDADVIGNLMDGIPRRGRPGFDLG